MTKTKRIAVKRTYLILLRQRYKVSGIDVAKALGLSQARYYRIERGEYDFDEQHRSEYLCRLANLYNLPSEHIIKCENNYLHRKVSYLLKIKDKKRIYTLHSETVKEYRRLYPNATKAACAAATGISRNTVSKYWDLNEEDNDDEEADYC